VSLAAVLLTTPLAAQRPLPQPTLGDTLLTLFDSVSAIHSTHPDTSLLRRLHPVNDTLVFIEGDRVEALTGDSLFRRVVALHRPVTTMTQEFTERRARVFDAATAFLSAAERVRWVDATGPHEWRGLLTLLVIRRGDRWIIRAYRG
jgi:hypothetical protein